MSTHREAIGPEVLAAAGHRPRAPAPPAAGGGGRQSVFTMIEDRGWQSRIVPIGHLTDLQEAIRGRYERGLIDEALYREQLATFSFDPPADLPGARSIVIVAVPTPQMRMVFHWHGKGVPVVAPPTYVSYTPRTESVQAVLAA